MPAKKKAFQPQLPFNADTPAILRKQPDPKAKVCQECALGLPFYAPCGKHAEFLVGWKGRNEPFLPMCAMCADHNVRNRGARATRIADPLPPEPLSKTKSKSDPIEDAVDGLGRLAAVMAPLKAREKELKEFLIKKGEGSYEGKLFRATVSIYDQDRLDMDAVRAKLTPQFIRANTTTTKVRKVDVRARIDQQTNQERRVLPT